MDFLYRVENPPRKKGKNLLKTLIMKNYIWGCFLLFSLSFSLSASGQTPICVDFSQNTIFWPNKGVCIGDKHGYFENVDALIGHLDIFKEMGVDIFFIEMVPDAKQDLIDGLPHTKEELEKHLTTEDEEEYPDLTIKDMLESLNERLKEEKGASKASWLVVKRLLGRLKRFGIFDSTEDILNMKDLLKAGKVSILDLSNSYTVHVNNIVIAIFSNF